MKIPTRLLQVLERDSALYAATLQTLEDFTPWMELSGTPFFPEYTRHDPHHIERVLHAACAILRDEAWQIFTPADSAVLTLAVLLHDAAMHLTEDGFLGLIRPDRLSVQALLPDDRPWPILWEEYLSLARRFNARELRDLFGDVEVVHLPAEDPRDWSLRDRLLIGDFLRRHHHRLAHEFAVRGVPAPPGNEPLRLRLDSDLADITGLVARSHGVPLRSSLDPLRNTYDLRQYRGIHAVCLMVLLRISDYLQVEADRAPRQLLQVKRLWSPISLAKWKEHHTVRDIRTTHEDPEAIFVDALPQTADQYFAIRKLLSGLQDELDNSWAVLGEVYGRWDELRGLGMSCRRVRSTLDDERDFAQSVEYLPRRAAFEASSGDLIPLLVAPLYGDNPQIGVRELLQNSLDAVRELSLYRNTIHGTSRKGTPAIRLELEKDYNSETHFLTIDDPGIGMTADTVCSYFLKVGASFRNSDSWRQNFQDNEGKSLVLRSGRFGIGVLAAFLLGEEVEVSTRHVDSEDGICFRAKLDTENVELRRFQRAIGTTIRVRLSERAVRLLTSKPKDWDWYCLSYPIVERKWRSNAPISQRYTLPGAGASLPPAWHRLVVSGYEDVQWSYDAAPALTCNGIVVAPERGFVGSSWFYDQTQGYGSPFTLKLPNISVFDPDGDLPLDLKRTGLARQLPFREQLFEDVIRDFIAFALLAAPQSRGGKESGKYAGIGQLSTYGWFRSPRGAGIVTAQNLQVERAGGSVLVVPSFSACEMLLRHYPHISPPIIVRHIDQTKYSSDSWIRIVLGIEQDYLSSKFQIIGTRIIIRRDWVGRLQTGPSKVRLSHSAMSKIQKETVTPKWEVWASGICPRPAIDFREISEQSDSLSNEKPVALAEIYLRPQSTEDPANLFDLLWEKHVGQPTIPYDLDQRRLALRRAFSELNAYVEAHELTGAATRGAASEF